MATKSKRQSRLCSSNVRFARAKWGDLNELAVEQLKRFSSELRLSVAAGDIVLLNGGWYVTHPGLIRLASRRHCSGISPRAGNPERRQ